MFSASAPAPRGRGTLNAISNGRTHEHPNSYFLAMHAGGRSSHLWLSREDAARLRDDLNRHLARTAPSPLADLARGGMISAPMPRPRPVPMPRPTFAFPRPVAPRPTPVRRPFAIGDKVRVVASSIMREHRGKTFEVTGYGSETTDLSGRRVVMVRTKGHGITPTFYSSSLTKAPTFEKGAKFVVTGNSPSLRHYLKPGEIVTVVEDSFGDDSVTVKGVGRMLPGSYSRSTDGGPAREQFVRPADLKPFVADEVGEIEDAGLKATVIGHTPSDVTDEFAIGSIVEIGDDEDYLDDGTVWVEDSTGKTGYVMATDLA